MKDLMFNYIKEIFIENINIKTKEDGNLVKITLPLFLGSGDPIIVSVRRNSNQIILTNGTYKNLRLIFIEKLQNAFEKDILDTDRYKSSIEKNLNDQNIEHSLSLKKKIKYIDEVELAKEILIYSFCIKNHYDYIYYDLLKKEKKTTQESILSNAIDSYVENFNIKSDKKIKKIDKNNFLSDKNNYYSANNLLFADVTNKVDFLDAKDDILDMLDTNSNTNKGLILYDRITPRFSVSDKYIEKLKKRLQKKNIKMLEIKNELDIEKLTIEIEG